MTTLAIVIGFWQYRPTSKALGSSIFTYTILIPTRNPDKNLAALVETINSQLLQIQRQISIIVINDHSSNDFDFGSLKASVLNLSDEDTRIDSFKNNKKESINLGVQKSSSDYIICLDSDVTIPSKWLERTIEEIEKNEPKFLAGLHRFDTRASFMGQCITIEQDLLTATSIATLHWNIPTMCNGANMAFKRKAFLEVDGYNGLYAITGGDDMLLYHRIFMNYPEEVHYLKSLDAAVSSRSPDTFLELLNQRARWMGKSFQYEVPWILPILMIISLAAIQLYMSATQISIHESDLSYWALYAGLLLFLIGSFSRYYPYQRNGIVWLGFVLIYPFYILVLAIFMCWRYFTTLPSRMDR
jgi:poly-beta-1,6-N-acetyl-D-glucosamine synthase